MTAVCILEFAYKYPLCAVDTHIWKMAQWLGWVPEEALETKTFMHLNVRLPDKLKHAIHQVFWHHPQKCAKCKKIVGENTANAGDLEGCPLENMLSRGAKLKKVGLKKVKKEDSEAVPPKYVPFAKMSLEVATATGYVYEETRVDDDYSQGSPNTVIKRRWVKENKLSLW